MATTRQGKRPSSPRTTTTLSKPRGVLHPRVQKVGPEHFGILCFDCAKRRSKFLQSVLDWTAQAAPGDVAATQHRRIALALLGSLP